LRAHAFASLRSLMWILERSGDTGFVSLRMEYSHIHSSNQSPRKQNERQAERYQ
jgi:hypothetical protein